MSNFNNRDVYKKAEKLQEEMLNSNSRLDFDSDPEQESLDAIKKKWRKRQIKKFNKLQHKQSEKKQIKKVVSGLTIAAILLIIVPFISGIAGFISGSSPENNTANTNESQENMKGEEKIDTETIKTILNEETEVNDNLVETLEELDSKQDPQKMQNAPVTEKKGLGKLFENVTKIQGKQKEHNRKLQKAIDMSDGKNSSLKDE